jgi:alpha-galactosidase
MANIAIIGAGSTKFTRKLCRDIMRVPELEGSEFRLMDIDETLLNFSRRLMEREIEAHGLSYGLKATTDRREALRDAKYILSFARIGGLEAWKHDVEIPLRYGVDQCIGDTLGPGGILYGQRGVAAVLDFCRDIREVSAPGALFLNYTNPMSIITWAVEAEGGVNAVGLCHGVQHTTALLAKALDVPEEDLVTQVGGVNHMAWFTELRSGDRAFGRDDILTAFENQPDLAARETCRLDILRRVGYFNTESNGFTTELLPWYRKRPDVLKEWIHADLESHHDSAISLGGYKANFAGIGKYREELETTVTAEIEPLDAEKRSEEHSSYIIEAMETGRPYRGTFNVRNGGCIDNLPPDAVVEVPCYVDRHGVSVPRFGPLPDMCASICSAMVSAQRLAVRAALTGDRWTLKQAVMMDPLAAAVCSTAQISDMVDEMLEAEKQWLPQYR